GAASDRANGGVQVGGRQIGFLGLGDFFDLGARQRADLVGVRLGRTLLHASGLLDEDRRGRGLHDEGEALVGESGDHHRNRQTGLHALRLGVERLAEFHDVQATLTQRRANRGRGVCLTSWYLQLDKADDLLRHALLLAGSNAHRERGGLPGVENQVFSTWLKSSSTGVARPKMVTDTRTLLFS